MRIVDSFCEAKIGITVSLTTQEQIILKGTVEAFKEQLEKKKKFKNDVCLNYDDVQNLFNFISKITKDVPSMAEAFEELFGEDIKESEIDELV